MKAFIASDGSLYVVAEPVNGIEVFALREWIKAYNEKRVVFRVRTYNEQGDGAEHQFAEHVLPCHPPQGEGG